ncbi:MAG: ABC transporter ATP-binding protein [Alphaproteobacteria bacterium]|nr:ABC transporter ATP-binding protein [Alphaproteobacteria bacterium]
MNPVSKCIPRTPEKALSFVFYVLRHCPRKMKLEAVAGAVFEVTAVSCDVLVTWSLGRIVGVITEAPPDMFWPAIWNEILILAGIWTLRNVAYRMREWMDRRYVPVLMNTTRALLFNRLIQQSQAFLHSNFAGVLANHVRRAGDVIGTLRDRLMRDVLPLTVRFAVGGALLWSISPLLTLFVLSSLALGVLCAGKTAPKWTHLSARQAESASRLTGYIVDSTTNLSAVLQNTGWREEQRRMTRAQDDLTKSFVALKWFGSMFWGVFDTLMTFFFCGFMALVAYGWKTGDVTTAQLAMAVGLVTNLFGAVAGTVYMLSAKFDDIGILKDSLQKISTPLSILDKKGAKPLDITGGVVEFRDVDFTYDNDLHLFKGLNLTIPAGQKVGLVGVSGAGKTTLCQLLLRAYDVTGGGIYIDGQNIADITQDSLHDNIAVIPQEPMLFHRTLAENIRYGRFTATDEEVVQAARAAEADMFIETLALKYETLVGERGVKLSGGQRQRVAIARAILKDAPVLVLDEATSALDSETERSIQTAMMEAMKGRTTIVIAHRLSTLSNMDRILVMEEGRVIEDGTFNDLLAAKGTFARLWDMQAGGFLPDAITSEAKAAG